jgi:hypothetical protein
MRRGLLPAPGGEAALASGVGVRFRKHSVAQNRGATFTVPGKFDD